MISLKESSDSISMPSFALIQEDLRESQASLTSKLSLLEKDVNLIDASSDSGVNSNNNTIHEHQNSPKFLASSQSGIRLPPLTENCTSPSLLSSSNCSSNGIGSSSNSIDSLTSPKQGTFIAASPKQTGSPNNKLVGFFSKSTSYQSLLSTALTNNHINSSPPLQSKNPNQSPPPQHQQQSCKSGYNSPPNPITSSPKRLARNEKAKSSPPLSPIPFPLHSTTDSSSSLLFNNELFSLGNSNSLQSSSLIPLALDKVINSNVDDNTNISNSSIHSPNFIEENISTSPSSHSPHSPRTPVGRARSNSKIQYSPNNSSCKILPPSLSPNTTSSTSNTVIINENNTVTSINNNDNNLPTNNINLTPNNNNNSNIFNLNNITTPVHIPFNNITSSPPIPIKNNLGNSLNNINNNNNNNNINLQQIKGSSSLPKNHDISILHLNNNYVCPSPSPSNIHSHYPPVSIIDFTLIEKIGEGGFGQVFLAKKNDTQDIVALKRMSKDLIWSKNKVSHIKNERDILAQGKDHRWIVSLVYSFQDELYLYLAMEYVPGGDLRSLLSALSSLGEDNARFYMAEMIEAVDSCHRLGYCHRDLKPENFLIDKTGHIKLADFGLSKNVVTKYQQLPSNKGTPTNSHMMPLPIEHTPMKFSLNTSVTDFGSFKDLNNQARLAYSVVGSPFYMAPEVLEATTGYGDEVDWWSLGCMFFEFIFGYPPFDGDSPEEVMENVLKWKIKLQRPDGISDQLWDLISRLICDGSTRLGSGAQGVDNIKAHPFFAGVKWGSLHNEEPPFVPVLDNELDTTYFENTEKLRSPVVYTNKNSGGFITSKSSKSQNRNILGFTYPRAQDDPLFLTNLLQNFRFSNEDINESSNGSNGSYGSSKSISTSTQSLTPPHQSPFNSSENIKLNKSNDSPYKGPKNNNYN